MKDHLRQNKKTPYNLMTMCNHNHNTGNGFSPISCLSPVAFKNSNNKCHHCEIIFNKKVSEAKK